jgi:hypothetical protein
MFENNPTLPGLFSEAQEGCTFEHYIIQTAR